MQQLSAFISSLIFGLGLLISGMSNPAKVLQFLDIAGLWNPTLMLVMLAAIITAMPAFYGIKRDEKSLRQVPIQLPTARTIDTQLLIGAVLFAAG